MSRELSEMAYLWREPHAIAREKLKGAIGDLPHTPLDVAVARALRDSPKTASLFLVALTAYGDEQARRDALDAGFDRHLTKPASLHDIRGILASLPCGVAANQRAEVAS